MCIFVAPNVKYCTAQLPFLATRGSFSGFGGGFAKHSECDIMSDNGYATFSIYLKIFLIPLTPERISCWIGPSVELRRALQVKMPLRPRLVPLIPYFSAGSAYISKTRRGNVSRDSRGTTSVRLMVDNRTKKCLLWLQRQFLLSVRAVVVSLLCGCGAERYGLLVRLSFLCCSAACEHAWEPFWRPVGGSCKKDSATYVQKVRRCMHGL